MTPHPTKRRRLNPPQDFSDDNEALLLEDDNDSLHPEVRDRIAARNRFKSALEGIFDKYSRDFTGVGDEIDLETGELVVDNGHLVRMEDEGDVDGLLGASEDDVDAEGDSDGDAPDRARDATPKDGQEADEKPLESLHLERSPIIQRHGKKLTSQAKDPKWQFPDLPDTRTTHHSDNASESDYEDEAQSEDPEPSLRNQLKSPGQSLWKGAWSSKNHEWTPIHRLRRQSLGTSIPIQHNIPKDKKAGTSIFTTSVRDPNLYSGKNSNIQADNSPVDVPRPSRDKKHAIIDLKEQGSRRTANTLSAKTGEWSVLEEQQLIRYRLNTHLSYAALASKFPGRTADMVRYRWRHLKKKMIELPISMEDRNNTIIRKNRNTSQRGGQTQSEHPYESFNSSKSRNYHAESSHRKDKRDAVRRLQTQATKSSNIDGNGPSFRESNQDTRNQKPFIDITMDRNSATFDFNAQDQNFGFPNGFNTLAETFRQEEAMPYPLKVTTSTNNPSGDSSAQEQEHLLLNNMWKAFPPYDQLSNMGNEENKENVNHLQWNSAHIEDAGWQDHFVDGLDFSFPIPLDLADQQPPPALYQSKLSMPQDTQAVQIDAANNGHEDNIDPDILTVAGPESHHMGLEPLAVSDAINFTTLASDIRTQDGNHTSQSFQHPAQPICSLHSGIDGLTTPESIHNGGPGSTLPIPGPQSATARTTTIAPLASIPNTTQDVSSPIALRNSSDATKQCCQGSSLLETERPVYLTHDEPSAPLQTAGGIPQEVLGLLSRESSPLSSLSSRDPRVARPSDLSSTLPDNSQEFDTSHSTIPAEPVLETRSVPTIETVEEDNLKSSEPQARNASNEANFRSSLQRSIPRYESIKPTISKADSAKSNRQTPPALSNASAVSFGKQKFLGCKRKVSDRTSISLQKMQVANSVFQILNDSFEQSSALLQPLTKQKSIAKLVRGRSLSNSHRTVSTNKYNFPVLPDKDAKYKNSWNASLRAEKRSASGSRRSTPSQQSSIAVPKSKYKLTDTIQHTSSHDDITLRERRELRRNVRATTPIDTYCYLLADPWPTGPLPADRIPGVWKAAPSKDNSHAKHETSGSMERQLSHGLEPSLSSVSSKVENVNTIAQRKQQIKGEARISRIPRLDKDVIKQQPAQTQVIPDSQPDLTSTVEQIGDENTHEAIVIKPIKLKPIAKVSTRIDHPLPLPRSPGRLAADGSLETSRRQSLARNPTDILLEFGKGRPLTKVNLLSQDEVASTSQETVLSFLNSQATQISRFIPTPRSSLLAQHSRPQNSPPVNGCGVNGIRCGRSLCFHCTAQATTQDDLEF